MQLAEANQTGEESGERAQAILVQTEILKIEKGAD
jgi:hypothetical protein